MSIPNNLLQNCFSIAVALSVSFIFYGSFILTNPLIAEAFVYCDGDGEECGDGGAGHPVIGYTINPSDSIPFGSSVVISWTSSNSSSCIGNGNDGFNPGGLTSGSQTITPSDVGSNAYWIRCFSPPSNPEGGAETVVFSVTTYASSLNASCSVSPTSIAPSQSATWSASASGGTGTYTYSWSGTDGLSGSTMNITKPYTNFGTKTGSVAVTSGSQSATVSCSNSLNVQSALAGSCSASLTSINTGESTTWSASASGGTGTYTYSWSGTDGLSGTAQNISKSYSNTGTKSATATISSGSESQPIACSNTVSVSTPSTQCSNGIDDDGDGLIDLSDYGCTSGADTTETPNPQCSDGIDNNGNGLIDLADTAACSSPTDGVEESLPSASLSFVGPTLVQPDKSALLVWSVANVEAGSCTIAGTNGENSGALSGTSGTYVSDPLTNETLFTLQCTDLNDDPVSESVTVKIAPSFNEI